MIRVLGSKGGAGASSFAVGCAVVLSESTRWQTVLAGPDVDLGAVCGLAGDAGPVTDRLSVWPRSCSPEMSAEHVVWSGPAPADGSASSCELEAPAVLVTRACYLALRRLVKRDDYSPAALRGFVLVDEPGRSLGARDVASVLGLEHLATVPFRASTSRAIDAGVFVTRMPAGYRYAVTETLRRLGCAVDDAPAVAS